LEVITGYPETLTVVVATLSQEYEDRVEWDIMQSKRNPDILSGSEHQGTQSSTTHSSSKKSRSTLSTAPLLATRPQFISRQMSESATYYDRDEEQFQRSEQMIAEWIPPVLPHTMSSDLRLALSMAWEVFRKAAFIFHWRGRGFYSDLRLKIRPDRAILRTVYVREIISSVRSLMGMVKEEGFVIGNTMLWPMAVVACECDTDINAWQSEVYDLFEDIQKIFALGQVAYIKQVLQILWNRKAIYHRTMTDTSTQPLSLEGIARELNLTIPLF
jgi:hypothetical protein